MADQRGPSGTPAPGAQAAGHDLQEKAKGTAHELQEKAKETVREVRDEAARRAESWTVSFGRQTESMARALRAARDSLWVEGEERMADVVGQAANQVDRFSSYLDDENPSQMMRGFTDLGRRNPAAFLGTAFVIGMIAGRFLRSSERSEEEVMEGDGHAYTYGQFENMPATADAQART